MNVLYIGDYDMGQYIKSNLQESVFKILPIRLSETPVSNRMETSDWKEVFVEDFHQLTIITVDFEPDVVIYISPYLNYQKCMNYPEYAFLLNDELVLHIKETTAMISPHIILIATDQVFKPSDKLYSELDPTNPDNILGETFSRGENNLKGYRKSTIIRSGLIIESDRTEIDNTKGDKSTLQYLSLEMFMEKLRLIITKKLYGIYHLVEDIATIPRNSIINLYRPGVNNRPFSKLKSSDIPE